MIIKKDHSIKQETSLQMGDDMVTDLHISPKDNFVQVSGKQGQNVYTATVSLDYFTKSINDTPDTPKSSPTIYASDLPEFQQWENEVTLGKVMKNWREAEDLTQEKVAQLLGVSKQVLSAYENNRKLPSIKKTIEIAEKLGASAKMWLIYRLETELRLQGLDYTVKLE